MDELLSSYRAEMERARQQRIDVISQASLLWRIIYGTVAQYRAAHPEIHVVRHEDLSLNPVTGFQQLYNALGLSFTPLAKQSVISSSTEENPTELAPQNPHSVQLNSRANLENWKHRLTSEEIGRVSEATADIFPLSYSKYEEDGGFALVEEGVRKS